MELLADPHAWFSFLTLATLEIVLGIDNIIFLSILVSRLPASRQKNARLLGLGFAMITRLGLLFSLAWLTTLRQPMFSALGQDVSGRDLILFAGGLFLVIKSGMEIFETLQRREREQRTKLMHRFWLIILQIGIIDIVFSLDTVFTAIGLARHIEVMVAAIVVSVIVMMLVSGTINDLIERYPTIKILALAFLILVGFSLISESLELDIPKGYLYFAMAFSCGVELINIRMRKVLDRRV